MRTLIIIFLGLILLALWIGVARALSGGDHMQVMKAVRTFVGLWFVVALGNLAIGVLQAGFGLMDELPIFLLVFGIPASAALFFNWKTS